MIPTPVSVSWDPRIPVTLRSMRLGTEGGVFPGGLLFLALAQQHQLTDRRVTRQRAEQLAARTTAVGSVKCGGEEKVTAEHYLILLKIVPRC